MARHPISLKNFNFFSFCAKGSFDEKLVKVFPQLFSIPLKLYVSRLNNISSLRCSYGKGVIEVRRTDSEDLWAGELKVGSRAKGLNIPSPIPLDFKTFLPSDLDIMFAKRPCKIIGNKEVPLFDVEYDQSDPRYVKLRMTEGIENQNISASVYVNNASQLFPSSMPPVYQ